MLQDLSAALRQRLSCVAQHSTTCHACTGSVGRPGCCSPGLYDSSQSPTLARLCGSLQQPQQHCTPARTRSQAMLAGLDAAAQAPQTRASRDGSELGGRGPPVQPAGATSGAARDAVALQQQQQQQQQPQRQQEGAVQGQGRAPAQPPAHGAGPVPMRRSGSVGGDTGSAAAPAPVAVVGYAEVQVRWAACARMWSGCARV